MTQVQQWSIEKAYGIADELRMNAYVQLSLD